MTVWAGSPGIWTVPLRAWIRRAVAAERHERELEGLITEIASDRLDMPERTP